MRADSISPEDRNVISYAQNGEDIILNRAFANVEDGFYIDVGANDPEQDSVTKLFYDRGWRGLNIEPSGEYHHKLCATRFRDINLPCLAGREDGEAVFHEIAETGLSTSRGELLAAHAERGYQSVEKTVSLRSLRSILDEIKPPAVHFLKVDVEGSELDVLSGADWERYRPWVVLVETTAPLEGGMEDTAIVRFMEQQGYARCLFDGINTYFVAGEHAELKKHFAVPANALDQFIRADLIKLLGMVRGQAAEIERQAAEIERQAAEGDRLIETIQKQGAMYAEKLAHTRNCLHNLENSWSWRLTAPLRLVDGLVRHRAATLKALRARFGPVQSGRANPGSLPVRIPELLSDFSAPTGRELDWSELRYPARPESSPRLLTSCLCSKAQLESAAFRYWLERIGIPYRVHRKLWEFSFIIQALYERGCLVSGARGLGFAVGEEPLPALFASMGCHVTATDLNPDDERAKPWAETAQLASSKEKLSKPAICPEALFEKLVSYRHVDMNHIPADLVDFDFSWSSCSFEHCGTIDLGLAFVENQMKSLKPGGIAVHTTEFNLTSDDETITEGVFVIFRRRDIEDLVRRLEKKGHTVEEICYSTGASEEDMRVDIFPYCEAPHLKLLLGDRFVSTSIGLIIRKGNS